MPVKSDISLPDERGGAETVRAEPPARSAAPWVLIALFLGAIGSVPMLQAMLELRRGEWPRALEVFATKPAAAQLRAYEKRLEGGSFLTDPLRTWTQFAQFHWLRDGGEKALVGREGWLFYRPGFDAMLRTGGRSGKEASGNNDPLAAMIAFREDLATRGIRLLLVPVPNKESVYPDYATRRAAGMKCIQADSTQQLFERLQAARFEVVDLFQLYAKARRDPSESSQEKLYLAQDSHWSPNGVEMAAQAVAQRLSELGWVKPGPARYALTPKPVRRVGDVLRMLQVPQLEAQAEPAVIKCRQVVDLESGQPYQASNDSEILVLGDSFLRIYEQDEPGSAGFAAHLAANLKRPVTELVSEGGASSLVRQELYRRAKILEGKRVVIWEFVERDILLGAEGWQVIRLP